MPRGCGGVVVGAARTGTDLENHCAAPYPQFERASTLVGRFVPNIDSCLGKATWTLLRLAEQRFDVLLSTDKGIPYQQNLSRFDLAVVLLEAESNAREHLAPPMYQVDTALASVEPGSVVRITPEPDSQR